MEDMCTCGKYAGGDLSLRGTEEVLIDRISWLAGPLYDV